VLYCIAVCFEKKIGVSSLKMVRYQRRNM